MGVGNKLKNINFKHTVERQSANDGFLYCSLTSRLKVVNEIGNLYCGQYRVAQLK